MRATHDDCPKTPTPHLVPNTASGPQAPRSGSLERTCPTAPEAKQEQQVPSLGEQLAGESCGRCSGFVLQTGSEEPTEIQTQQNQRSMGSGISEKNAGLAWG